MPVMIACALASINSTAWAAQSNKKSNERDEGKACSNQTLHGDYGLTIESLLIPGPGTQVRGVVMQSFDGNGHFTQVDHVVVDGTPPPLAWTPGTGTYTVNPDCTGKATISVPSSPHSPFVVYFVLVDHGREMRQVVDGSIAIATGRRVK